MGEVVLTGQLQHVSLPALLQLVDNEMFSGALRIDAAEVGFAQGQAVRASLGAFEGRVALLELFLLPAGKFDLSVGDNAAGRPLGDCMELVMTGCRLSDEWQRLGPLHLDEVSPLQAGSLAPLQSHLRHATVAAAVAAAGVAKAAVIDPLIEEMEAGRLKAVRRAQAASPEAAPPEAAPPKAAREEIEAVGSWHDLLDSARTHARAREFDRAEALLSQALVLAPGERIVAQNLARIRMLRAHHGEV